MFAKVVMSSRSRKRVGENSIVNIIRQRKRQRRSGTNIKEELKTCLNCYCRVDTFLKLSDPCQECKIVLRTSSPEDKNWLERKTEKVLHRSLSSLSSNQLRMYYERYVYDSRLISLLAAHAHSIEGDRKIMHRGKRRRRRSSKQVSAEMKEIQFNIWLQSIIATSDDSDYSSD